MHECPECGQACDCDLEDVWTDFNDNCVHPECEADDDELEGYDLEACIDCGELSIAGICQCCGGDLCEAHSKAALGLCKNCRKTRGLTEG
jgi:hypothetical protein